MKYKSSLFLHFIYKAIIIVIQEDQQYISLPEYHIYQYHITRLISSEGMRLIKNYTSTCGTCMHSKQNVPIRNRNVTAVFFYHPCSYTYMYINYHEELIITYLDCWGNTRVHCTCITLYLVSLYKLMYWFYQTFPLT